MKITYHHLLIFAFICLLASCTQPVEDQNEVASINDKITVEDVERGIRENIAQKVKDDNGYFHFTNDSIDLNLRLVRVHTEYLSVLGPNEFFACVDLATIEGDVYDVDFFMTGTKDSMYLTRTELHKINGKPFYSWKQNADKTWVTVPIKQSNNQLLGVVEGSDAFTFTYAFKLPEINSSAEIWLPVAQTDSFQTIEIVEINFPTDYQIIKDQSNENNILYAGLSKEESNTTGYIKYQVKRLEKQAYPAQEGEIKLYLGSESFLPVNNRFIELSDEIFQKAEANTSLTKARALYDYIIDNMRYAKQGKYGTGDAMYACDSKSGNCTEFHSLFISLARSSGIPARFAVGAAIPSERNEGGVNGYHCWAEFYADGKWWPVDISEANKYTALATYYFGHHPANRIEFSKGRNLEIIPSPRSGKVNFLAYPVFENDGELVQIKTDFRFERKSEF